MDNLLYSENFRSLCRQNKVGYLGLFGSYARGDYSTESDVDLLVKFEEPVGYFKLVQTQRAFEELLGKKVDLVTEGAISKYIRPYVYEDLKDVYVSKR